MRSRNELARRRLGHLAIRLIAATALLAICVPLPGATIADLQGIASKLSVQRPSPPGWRGESPLLTAFKHELREWVESKLVGESMDTAVLATELNAELKQAGLLCPEGYCGADNNLGFVGDLQISKRNENPGWLVVTTSVGIVCECDQSIYLYELRDGKWQRRLQSEQNDYGEGRYKPQWVSGELSVPDNTGSRLFLTVGFNPACISVWQEGYFRVFRVGAQAKEVLDWEQGMVNIGEDINHKVEPREVLVEFGSGGLEPGFVRPQVLHFKVESDGVRRIEPIALQPADFVDEWLTQTWPTVAAWSKPDLDRPHAKLHGARADETTEFAFAQRCVDRLGEWQVGVSFEKLGMLFFLVEDRGDFKYRMLDVSARRQPGCPGEDPIDFGKHPTLFPKVKPQ